MSINLRDRLMFLFNGGRGIGTGQLAGLFTKRITAAGVVTQQGAGDAEETVNLALSTARLDRNLSDHIATLDSKLVDMTVERTEVWSEADADDFAVAFVSGAERDRIAAGQPPTNTVVFASTRRGSGGVTPIFRFRSSLRRHDYRFLYDQFYDRFDFIGTRQYANDDEFGYYALFPRSATVPGDGPGGLVLDPNTDVVCQHHDYDEHTRYRGDVEALDAHEALPGAHQDSPRRVAHLDVNAPVGRRVYLTQTNHHPPTEHIFSVPMRQLGADSGRSSRFIGASVVQLSSQIATAPPTSADVTGYPGIFHANRLAAIWQRGFNQNIYVAIAHAIGVPTALHVSGAGRDFRLDLAYLAGSQHIIGGVTYRVYGGDAGRAGIGALAAMMAAGENLSFSLAVGTDYVEADGTLDAGIESAPGPYESAGGGVWNAIASLHDHASDPGAHQDSPRRVARLGIEAPVGRRVYLTETIRHPQMERIFSVDVGRLAPNNLAGIGQFVGAAVVDFSAHGGPVATADPSGLPAVMNAARIAGVWQHDATDSFVTFAVASAGDLAAAAPTHVHIASGGVDQRIVLGQQGALVSIGGIDYRIMRTTGFALARFLSGVDDNANLLRFSMEFPSGYLVGDGTIDDGIEHTVGEYESIGGGQWRSRGSGIIARLVAELADANDADKFALVSALHATPEVLYTEGVASVKSRDMWLNIQLSRALTVADNNKLLAIRFVNARKAAEAQMLVRRFLALTPMDATDDQFDERAEALPLFDGRFRGTLDFTQGEIEPLFVGRPTEVPLTTRRIILGSNGFGSNNQQNWGACQVTIELRSL